jgi:N-acetylglutamate synthase-like GNAT family acetyltransferase
LVSVRLANEDDNARLLELVRMCPQGTNLVLQFDRSPDFFSRSRAYQNYKVFVVEEEGKIVGTVGTTLKSFNMGGIWQRAYTSTIC